MSNFTTLNLKPTNDKQLIESAFRKLAIKSHPNKGGNRDQFIKLLQARNRLLQKHAQIQVDVPFPKNYNPSVSKDIILSSFYSLNNVDIYKTSFSNVASQDRLSLPRIKSSISTKIILEQLNGLSAVSKQLIIKALKTVLKYSPVLLNASTNAFIFIVKHTLFTFLPEFAKLVIKLLEIGFDTVKLIHFIISTLQSKPATALQLKLESFIDSNLNQSITRMKVINPSKKTLSQKIKNSKPKIIEKRVTRSMTSKIKK